MLPAQSHASADANASAADACCNPSKESPPPHQAANRYQSANETPGLETAKFTANRTDLSELRKLRNRLLKQILENQHRREQQRQRGLTLRSGGLPPT